METDDDDHDEVPRFEEEDQCQTYCKICESLISAADTRGSAQKPLSGESSNACAWGTHTLSGSELVIL